MLLWPAFRNDYPILFSDTHAFLVQGDEPRMIWDKPFIYGPFLRLLHAHTTLWLPAAAQALLVSHMLWLAQMAFARPSALWHLAVCAVLAWLTAASWTASLLMPDIFAPLTVLALFVLAFGDRVDRPGRIWAGIVATLAIASHLSHILVALACLVAILLVRPARVGRAAAPLAVSIGLLIATNAVGFGRFAVSPYGSVFLLARLVADGPAAATLQRECPHPGWLLCRWAARLPTDSDAFLWDGNGPVWTYPGGPTAMGREAGQIIADTVVADPVGVAQAMAVNTARQLLMVRPGDTLTSTWLEGSVTNSLRDYLPPVELRRFRASLQAADRLAAIGRSFYWPQVAALVAGLAGVLMMLSMARSGRARTTALAAMVLLSLLANAFATGALSNPHDRYQARIAWLLVAAPLLALVTAWSREDDDYETD